MVVNVSIQESFRKGTDQREKFNIDAKGGREHVDTTTMTVSSFAIISLGPAQCTYADSRECADDST